MFFILDLLFIIETLILLLLMMPFGDAFKQKVGTLLDKQSWASQLKFGAYVLMALLFGSTASDSYQRNKHEHVLGDPVRIQLALEAKLNSFLAAFLFIEFLAIHRYYKLMSKSNQQERKLYALERQANNLSSTAKSFVEQNSQLAQENSKLKSSDAGPSKSSSSSPTPGSTDSRATSLKELSEKERIITQLNREREKQTEEYVALVAENKKLKGKLEDFELMFDSSKRKKD